MKKSDLIVMNEMAGNDMDIRSSYTVIDIKKVNGGCSISFGIDNATGQMLMQEFASGQTKHYCAMFVINKEQFDKLKSQS